MVWMIFLMMVFMFGVLIYCIAKSIHEEDEKNWVFRVVEQNEKVFIERGTERFDTWIKMEFWHLWRLDNTPLMEAIAKHVPLFTDRGLLVYPGQTKFQRQGIIEFPSIKAAIEVRKELERVVALLGKGKRVISEEELELRRTYSELDKEVEA